MLTKTDKKWIRDTLKEVVTEALTVEVMMVRKRDPETGVPLATEQHHKEKVYLPNHWVDFLPFYEQSINLCQDSAQKARNRAVEARAIAIETGQKVDAVGKLYLDLEKPLKVLASFSDAIQNNQITMNEHLKLVYESDSK